MEEQFQTRVEQLAEEFASSATTIGELNQLMRLMMKSGLERMLDSEMDVHLGRRGSPAADASSAAVIKQGSPVLVQRELEFSLRRVSGLMCC